jgi:prepilin signal peptidase PulO-like enzyme (type II secretory pathway)
MSEHIYNISIRLITKNKKDFLPLGPFLFAGTLIAYLI